MTAQSDMPAKVEEGAKASRPVRTEPFYPHHLIRQVIQVLLVFAVLAALATLQPAPMGVAADPTQMPGKVGPEWVFLAAHHVLEVVKHLPVAPLLQRTVGVSIVALGFLVILLVPYLDRRAERRPRKRPVALALMALAVGGYLALTFWPKLMELLL